MKNLPLLFFLLCTSHFCFAQNLVDYSDVAVIVNENSAVSLEIGAYFQASRNIPEENMIHISTSTEETIDDLIFEDARMQIENYLLTSGILGNINYLVTTTGIPLRIEPEGCGISPSTFSCAAFDSEIALILGSHAVHIGQNWIGPNPYFDANKKFSRAEYDIFLVTRLDGNSKEDVFNMICRSGPNTRASKNSSNVLLDLNMTNNTGEKDLAIKTYTLYTENINELNLNWEVYLDTLDQVKTQEKDVMVYMGLHSKLIPEEIVYNWSPGSICDLPYNRAAISMKSPMEESDLFFIADFISQGATSAHGNTFYTYWHFLLKTDLLIKAYFNETETFNLAESYWLAMPKTSWSSVIIGDPKTNIIVDPNLDEREAVLYYSINIYPNPSTGIFKVRSESFNIEEIRIWNTLGQLVYRSEEGSGTGIFRVDISHQAAGEYAVEVVTPQGTVRKMIVMVK